MSWTSTNLAGNVKVEYSTDGGGSWSVIAANTANDGTELWTVPNTPTAAGRVRVAAVGDAGCGDQSDGAFSILGSTCAITVTAPSGGQSWAVGSAQSITWTGSNAGANVKIELSRDGGATWNALAASAPNNGLFAWVVTAPATTQARVRVSSTATPTCQDAIDSNFAITEAAAVALASVSVEPSSVKGGVPSTGTVRLTGAAGTGGVSVKLTSKRTATATVPGSVTVPPGADSATFAVTTKRVRADTTVKLVAKYLAVKKTTSLRVTRR